MEVERGAGGGGEVRVKRESISGFEFENRGGSEIGGRNIDSATYCGHRSNAILRRSHPVRRILPHDDNRQSQS